MPHLIPPLSGDVSRILLFLKAIRYGRPEEILPEFLLTVKNLSFAPGGPVSYAFLPSKKACGIHKFWHFRVRQQYPVG